MCQRFIHDFVEKVAEKNCCDQCKERKKICKVEKDYNHLDEKVIQFLFGLENYLIDCPYNFFRDIILSFLHNKMFLDKCELAKFLKFIYLYDKHYIDVLPKIERHDVCFNYPDYIICEEYYRGDSDFYVYDNMKDYREDPGGDNGSILSLKEFLDEYIFEDIPK